MSPSARLLLALWLAAFGLGCPAGTVLGESPGVASNEPPVLPKARLREVKGDVKVKRAAGDDWQAATPSMELYENDKVRTSEGASAQIDFVNGSLAKIGEEALLSIAETHTRPGQDRTDLTLHKGRVAAELEDPGKQSLTVTTPSATVRSGREIVFQ